MKTAVVINHKAGATKWSEQAIDAAFKQVDWPVTLHCVQPKQLPTKLEQLCQAGVKTVIVGGGDGSFNTAATLLANRPVTLGILPMGTFNLFAHDINMPTQLPEAVRALKHATPQYIDLAKLNQHYFVNKASIGLHPYAIEMRHFYQQQWGLSKRLAITIALLGSVWHSPNLCLTLERAATQTVVKTPFLVVSNNRYDTVVGKLLNRDQLDEGCLGIHYAHKISRLTLLRMGFQAFFNWKLKQISELDTENATELQVQIPCKKVSVALDGEILKLKPPLHFQILPKVLQVLIPPNSGIKSNA